MTGIVCALIGSVGAAGDTQYVTSGTSSSGTTIYVSGRASCSGSYGSISDGTSNIYGGATVSQIDYSYSYNTVDEFYAQNDVIFRVTGTFANSGWTTMYIDGTPFYRADADFNNSGGSTMWTWNILLSEYEITPSPFVNVPSIVTWE